jgi:hypothetical protein
MLRSLRESWRRRAADRSVQRHEDAGHEDRRMGERRKEERRKEQLPLEGPDRRQGKDRRQYVRRVMSGEIPLPAQERRGSH